ncbi:MAG: DUF2178 domain-containing protein [Candidatus Methanoperedens sp.]|nr:DUF2178 domain-containing protein [Candidatus Methanoperedens sp.]
MTLNNKVVLKIDLIIGVVFFAAGILLDQSAAVGVGIATMISGMYHYTKYGDQPLYDERTKKISGYAASSTLLAMMLSMAALMIADELKLLILTGAHVLAILFFVMVLFLNLSLWYFNRKGDVE